MYVDETLSFSFSSMSNFKHSDQELIGCSLSNSSFVTFASTSKDCCFVIIFLWLQIPWWTAAEACGGLQKWLPYIIGYRISAFCSSVEGFIEANSRKPRREREEGVKLICIQNNKYKTSINTCHWFMQCTVCTRYILPSERTPCCADLIRPVRLEKTPVSSTVLQRD